MLESLIPWTGERILISSVIRICQEKKSTEQAGSIPEEKNTDYPDAATKMNTDQTDTVPRTNAEHPDATARTKTDQTDTVQRIAADHPDAAARMKTDQTNDVPVKEPTAFHSAGWMMNGKTIANQKNAKKR